MPALDQIMGNLGGRKFLAWLGTCGMLLAGSVSEHSWLYITMFYIGGQAAVDALASLKGAKKPSPSTLASKPETEEA
jgi:hypothetical protein